MNASPLGSLTAEIRNQIYELVVTQAEPIHITSTRTPFAKLRLSRKDALKHPLGLTRTCWQAFEETLLMFYASNSFTFYIDDSSPSEFQEVSQVALTFLMGINKKAEMLIPKITLATTGVVRDLVTFHGPELMIDIMHRNVDFLRMLAPQLNKALPSCQFVAELGTPYPEGDPKNEKFHLNLENGLVECDAAIVEVEDAMARHDGVDGDYRYRLSKTMKDLQKVAFHFKRMEGRLPTYPS